MLSNKKIVKFKEIIKKHVSNELTFHFYGEKKWTMFIVRFRGFIVEKIMIDQYFWTKLVLPTAIWYNYIKPMRRRISAIRQPLDWRIKGSIKKILNV